MRSGVERAYDLISRCYALTNDAGLQDRMTVLGEVLSDLLSCHKRNITLIARTEPAPMLAGHIFTKH